MNAGRSAIRIESRIGQLAATRLHSRSRFAANFPQDTPVRLVLCYLLDILLNRVSQRPDHGDTVYMSTLAIPHFSSCCEVQRL